MNENLIAKAYEMAKERYAEIGVDTDKAIELLEKTPISIQCWQADDVMGFENDTALTGGIQAATSMSSARTSSSSRAFSPEPSV